MNIRNLARASEQGGGQVLQQFGVNYELWMNLR